MTSTLKQCIPALPFLVLAWATTPALANHHEARNTTATQPATDDFVNAEVRRIDRDNGKLTLKHEALRKFDMAAMTMVFRVADPAMLDGLAVGDKVRFVPDQINGQFVVRKIEKQN